MVAVESRWQISGKEGLGGGDESEDIVVHEIPLDQIKDWLAEATAERKLIDARVYTGLYFLSQ